MRISTNTMYEAGVARMNELQSTLLKTQQQVASGRKILTPADDPVGAAQALNLAQGKSLNTQYGVNRQNATSALAQEETVLQSVTGLIQDVKDAVIQAGNPSYDDHQRGYIATDLRTRFDELLGHANSRDGLGNFMFSGYQIATQPFSKTATGASYAGDQGVRMMQIDDAREIAVGDSGATVFGDIPSSGAFASASDPANGGSATVSPLQVVDARLLTDHNYDVVFAVSGGVTTYSVYDTTLDPTRAGAPLVSATYTAPQTISFDGLQMTASGVPADGDVMTVRPDTKQSLFTTLSDLIALLEAPGSGVLGGANLAHGLKIANSNLDNALDGVLAVRASVGARLKEIETRDEVGDAKNQQYAQSLSDIQDLDYNQALSDLARHQLVLQAAQQSFVKLSGLSLFDLL
jgi:flagellar hook-associated protein 3 FlgL